MKEPTYRLKKTTPELKKGAILKIKGCFENKDYDYVCEDEEYLISDGQEGAQFNRDVVEKQPNKWFEKISQVWVTAEQLKKIKKCLK